MKPTLYALLCCAALTASISPAHADETNTATTVIIPIQSIIGKGLLYVIRRGIDDALRLNAETIIFDMNTPGGRVDVTEEIIRTFIDLPTNITTYTYINKDALSAGAMIAIATKHIYMAPGSRIGASAIVTSTGDIEDGDMKEKHVSSLTSLVRNAAVRNGHDPNLIESMIRKDMKYELDGEVICKEGQLLTLSDLDAAKQVTREGTQQPLLSAGTAKTLDELIAQLGLDNTKTHRIEITSTEKIARFIEMFSIIFLAGGLLGIYIEFKTPGFGVPGIAGMLLLSIFFWGHHVAGLTGSLELLIFALGIILLALEIFVIPGFGVAGISGLCLIALSLFMAMIEHYPGTDWYTPPGSFQLEGAGESLGISLGLTVVLALMAALFLPKTKVFHSLQLSSELDRKHGVTASAPTDSLLGAKGLAATQLHPSGFGTFGSKRINVIARGAFIDAGAPIVVAETHGSRIVVDAVRSMPSTPTNTEDNTST
jgi:membrane-bound serine protease (ClpP class)